MPPKKRDVSLRQLAQELGLGVELVRNVLKELPGSVSREVQDKIYRTARKLGYEARVYTSETGRIAVHVEEPEPRRRAGDVV